ncbi:MAG: transporter [Gammaproteobacteria bacterium]|nr:transporter [Gammaproteobacteria bacterium]
MEIDLRSLLSANPILLIFTIIGIGYILGKIKLAGIEFGSTSGILIIGLLFGHLGFVTETPHAGTFGFIIFIYTVGLQAGPSFFSAFLADGRRYILLALIVSLTAVAMVFLITKLVGFEYGLNAGLLAGALTSTPTLAGAQDAITSGLASLPETMDADSALQNIGAAYAITYIFGTMGLIIFINYFPALIKIDLVKSAEEYATAHGLIKKETSGQFTSETLPIIRAYEVSEEGIGKTIEQRVLEFGKVGKPLRVRRGNKILEADNDLVFEKGDIVSFITNIAAHEQSQSILGHEILDPALISFQIIKKQIVVINQDAIDKPIKNLDMAADFGCFTTELIRAGIKIPITGETIIQKGDRISVTGEELNLQDLADKLGYFEGEVEHTDLVTFAFGIVAGLLLGSIFIKFGNLSIGLGSAGGLLISGIVIGFLSSVNPTFGSMPVAARNLLMNFGLAIFMASVGLGAGEKVVDAFISAGLPLILCGIMITITPVLVAYAFGRFILKMNPALLIGAITGAMTSTPSLSVVTEASKSYIPAIGYAGTYTFANVFLTFAGTLMVII